MADGAKVRTVSDLMTSDVLTATPSETIADVSARMGDRKVGSIVVVDDARPVGILTERDMIKIAASGTDSCRIVFRNTAETTSAAPATASNTNASGSVLVNPKAAMAAPQITTATMTARPWRRTRGTHPLKTAASRAPAPGAA